MFYTRVVLYGIAQICLLFVCSYFVEIFLLCNCITGVMDHSLLKGITLYGYSLEPCIVAT